MDPDKTGGGVQSSESDEVLMMRVAEGDTIAFERLLNRHARRITIVAQGITADPAQADDIAQEALTRVWINANKWNPDRGSFATWLNSIVVNLCIDHQRKMRARTPVTLGAELSDPTVDMLADLSNAQAGEIIRCAIQAIPVRQRVAVTLFYYAELSIEEAAKTMGIRRNAFEVLLVRARRSLQARLMAHGYTGHDL